MLFATLATRGMGFLNSFLLSRLVGVQALGEYAGLVNTASAVATPFAQAVTNNATVLGAEGNRKGSTYFRALAKKNLILVAGLSIFLMGAFVLLYEHALGPRDEGGSTLFLIGGGQRGSGTNGRRCNDRVPVWSRSVCIGIAPVYCGGCRCNADDLPCG